MSYQVKTQTMIKSPIDIILGKSISGSECTLQTHVISYKTSTPATDMFTSDSATPHHLCRLMSIAEAMFAYAKTNATDDYSAAAETPAMVCYNLGRLAREKINDDTYLKAVKDMAVELRKKLSTGVEATHAETTYARDVADLWYALGEGASDMFGDWSFTQWKPVDDALAGMWIIFFYVLHHWGVQVSTWFSKEFARGIGEYVTSGGAIEGRLKKLNPYNEADWPLRFITAENGVGDIMGINQNLVDNEFLKGLQVPILDTVEPFIQKYFSKSRILWRYMRWVDITPIYTCLSPGVAVGADGNLRTPKTVAAYDYMSLFGTTEDRCDWDWWNTRLVDFAQRLQTFKFRGKNGPAFGKLKTRIKLTNVYSLPEPGVGQGGLFWHQMTTGRVDLDVGADDCFLTFKHMPFEEGSYEYTPAGEPDILQLRRDKNDFYWYQLIGDIDPEMFQFLIGCHITQAKPRNGVSAYLKDTTLNAATNQPTYFNYPYSPTGIITFNVLKDEDEGYYVDPIPETYTFDMFIKIDTTYTFFGTPTSVMDWGNQLVFESGNSIDSEVELNSTPNDYYDMRSNDPYKKLVHTVRDLNELDAVAIRKVMSKTFLGASAAEEVALSAGLEIKPISQRLNGDDGTKPNTGDVSVSANPIIPTVSAKPWEKPEEKSVEESISADVGISATPESVAKMEHALKVAKDSLAADKKKEENKKKEESKK